jgi:hypothetical protein
MPSAQSPQFRFLLVETVRSYPANRTALIDGSQPSGIYMGYTVRGGEEHRDVGESAKVGK